MNGGGPAIRPFTEIGESLRSILRPPLLTLLLLELLLVGVAESIYDLLGPDAADEYVFLASMSSVFFTVVSLYLHIAITMVAASGGEAHGADPWIKAALRQRCFWRYLGASLLAAFFTLVGAVAFVVGAVIVGGTLALSAPAVVLERKRPIAALHRSQELTKPVRKAAAIIFLLLWMPGLVPFVLLEAFNTDLDIAIRVAIALAGNVLAVLATIAFARMFVKLGGAPTPPLQTLLYKAEAGSSR